MRHLVRALPACFVLAAACHDAAPLEGTSDASPVDASEAPEVGPAVDIALDAAAPDDAATAEDASGACDGAARAFGCPCDVTGDCASGLCVEGPDGNVCTRTCTETCPDGLDCRQVTGIGDGASVCMPRHVSLCRPCRSDDDCSDGTCEPAADPDAGSFCATACSDARPCPSGFACADGRCAPEGGATCTCRPSWAERGFATDCRVAGDGAFAAARCTGTRGCGPAGLSACDARAPVAEVCDSVDNDCDDKTDNVDPDLTLGLCALQAGVCAGARQSASLCTAGSLAACGPNEYGAHFVATPEADCDGRDNDCDEATDEGFVPTEVTCGVGECRQTITTRCEGGRVEACTPKAASAEVCDGRDNDCDDQTDEDYVSVACTLSTPGLATTCPGQTLCASGGVVCQGTPPSLDVCDGRDNDCSGAPDDGTARLSNCTDVGCRLDDNRVTYANRSRPGCSDGACTYATASCGYFGCAADGASCLTACTAHTDCIATAACIDGACRCPEGYAGSACQDCADGFQDKDRDGTCEPDCDHTRCVGGTCSDASGTAICTCEPGYLGAACDTCDAPAFTDPEGDGTCERRGPLVRTASPVTSARVGFAWRFVPTASQAGAMPGDVLTWTLVTRPSTRLTWTAATGVLAWTPVASEVTWSPDPGATKAPHRILLRATAVDGQTLDVPIDLAVYPAMTITGVHPAAGRAAGNEELLVFGSGFVEPEGGAGATGKLGLRFGSSSGSLDGTEVVVVDASTLKVRTPAAEVGTRTLTVTAGGSGASPAPSFANGFTHLPRIERTTLSLSRARGDAIGGPDLATNLGTNATVTAGFHTVAAHNVLAVASRGLSERRIVGSGDVPPLFTLGRSTSDAELGTGPAALVVYGFRSNPMALNVTDAVIPARLTVVGSKSGAAAGSLVLVGAGFQGLALADVRVGFAGFADPVAPTAINTAGTEVTVAIPEGARTGPVTLTATGSDPQTSSVPIQIPGSEPVLAVTAMSPDLGRRGSVLILEGSGFLDREPLRHRVAFDGVAGRVLSAEGRRLVVEVPVTAPFGPNLVTVAVDPELGGPEVEAGVYGVSGTRDTLVSSGATVTTSPPDGAFPTAATLVSNAVHVHPSGLIIFAEASGKLRAFNHTASPFPAFGKSWQPNALGTLRNSGGGGAFATGPGGDLFVGQSSKVVRLAFTTGAETDVVGKAVAGGSVAQVARADATFNGILDLLYDADRQLLLIADDENNVLRVLNMSGGTVFDAWGQTLQKDTVHVLQPYGTGNPTALAMDGAGNLYFSNLEAVRKIRANRTNPTGLLANIGTDTELIVFGDDDLGVRDGEQSQNPADPRLRLRFQASGLELDPLTGDLFLGSRGGVVRRIVSSGGFAQGVTPFDRVEVFAGLWPQTSPVPVSGDAGDGGDPLAAALSRSHNLALDAAGQLYVAGSGVLRRITRDQNDGRGLSIATVAGQPPASLDGAAPVGATSVGGGRPLVDAARNRVYFTGGNRVLALDRQTNTLTTIAGTGVLGNSPPGTLARAADLGSITGLSFDGPDHLLITEAVLPRITRVSLVASDAARVLEPFLGDGDFATTAEVGVETPLATARANVNTGVPDTIRRDDGLVFYGNNDVVRVVNPTDAPLSAFGRTFAPRSVWRLSQSVGVNLGGIHLDARGDLWVTGLSSNTVVHVSSVPPYAVTTVVQGTTTTDPGFHAGGRLKDLRLNQPSGVTTDAAGNLYLTTLQNAALYVVRARDGVIDGDCLVAPVFGSGAGSNGASTAPPAAYGLGSLSKVTVDGADLLLNGHSRLWRMTTPQ